MKPFMHPAVRKAGNLRRLYSTIPGHSVAPHNNFVNLGNFYAGRANNTGWAYLQDGSIYIHPSIRSERFKSDGGRILNHDTLESRLKILTKFVEDPVTRIKEDLINDPEKRLIIVRVRRRQDVIVVNARAARAGETLDQSSFETACIQLDTSSAFLATKPDSHPRILTGQAKNLICREAYPFRGTLIDGVLQPNVRLGNGLCLSGFHDRMMRLTGWMSPVERSQLEQKEKPQIKIRKHTMEQQINIRHYVVTKSSFSENARRKAGLHSSEKDLEAKEESIAQLEMDLLNEKLAVKKKRSELEKLEEEPAPKRSKQAASPRERDSRVEQTVKQKKVEPERKEKRIRCGSSKYESATLPRIGEHATDAPVEEYRSWDHELAGWVYREKTAYGPVEKAPRNRDNAILRRERELEAKMRLLKLREEVLKPKEHNLELQRKLHQASSERKCPPGTPKLHSKPERLATRRNRSTPHKPLGLPEDDSRLHEPDRAAVAAFEGFMGSAPESLARLRTKSNTKSDG